MRIRTTLAATVLVAVLMSFPAAAQTPNAPDPWAPLRFLLGSWSAASGSGQPGEAVAGSVSFALELGGGVLVRRNRTEYAPKPGAKEGAVHEDLLVIYREPGEDGFRALYWDNEGHVIHYRVSIPSRPNVVMFESEGPDKGPRFRLVHELASDGQLATEFAIAPPGGDFKTYVKGTVRRKP